MRRFRASRPARAPRLLLAAAAAAALAGCTSILDPETELVLEIAEMRVPCMGIAPQECLLVRQDGRGEPQYFYDAIDGFDFEPGWRYRLEVGRRTVRNPPADGSSYTYRLKRVLSRSPSPRADLLRRIEAAETLWLQRRPARYTLVEERICFCAPDGRGPVRILATPLPYGPWENVESRAYVADGRPVDGDLSRFFLGVHELFGHLRLAIARDAHRIDVTFDERDGFPRETYVDWSASTADEEVGYRVLSLESR